MQQLRLKSEQAACWGWWLVLGSFASFKTGFASVHRGEQELWWRGSELLVPKCWRA